MEDLKLYLSGIVCATCLSSDRVLTSIKNVPHVERLLPKLKFNLNKDRICWECYTVILKFVKFQEKAYTSQEILQDFVEGNVKTLQTRSSLKWVVSINGEIQQRLDTSSKIEFNNGDNNDAIETVNFVEEDNSKIGYFEYIEYGNRGSTHNMSDWQYEVLDDELEALNDDMNIPDDFEISDQDTNKLINATLKALLEDAAKADENNTDDIYETDDESPNDNQCANENDCGDDYVDEVCIDDDELNFKANIKFEGQHDNVSTKILKEKERGYMINREKQNGCYRNATFKCEKCVFGYDTADEYIDHMRKHDEKRGPEVCGICEQRFSDKASLTDHWSHHYTAFYCTICGYTSRFLKFVVSHQEKNQCFKKSQPVWFQCDKCNDEFALESLLNHHKSLMHKVEFKCKYCDKSFTKHAVLKAHLQTHKSRMNMKCVICNQICLDAKSLQVHMRVHRAAKKRSY